MSAVVYDGIWRPELFPGQRQWLAVRRSKTLNDKGHLVFTQEVDGVGLPNGRSARFFRSQEDAQLRCDKLNEGKGNE